jgi:hypothetical protein
MLSSRARSISRGAPISPGYFFVSQTDACRALASFTDLVFTTVFVRSLPSGFHVAREPSGAAASFSGRVIRHGRRSFPSLPAQGRGLSGVTRSRGSLVTWGNYGDTEAGVRARRSFARSASPGSSGCRGRSASTPQQAVGAARLLPGAFRKIVLDLARATNHCTFHPRYPSRGPTSCCDPSRLRICWPWTQKIPAASTSSRMEGLRAPGSPPKLRGCASPRLRPSANGGITARW